MAHNAGRLRRAVCGRTACEVQSRAFAPSTRRDATTLRTQLPTRSRAARGGAKRVGGEAEVAKSLKTCDGAPLSSRLADGPTRLAPQPTPLRAGRLRARRVCG